MATKKKKETEAGVFVRSDEPLRTGWGAIFDAVTQTAQEIDAPHVRVRDAARRYTARTGVVIETAPTADGLRALVRRPKGG